MKYQAEGKEMYCVNCNRDILFYLDTRTPTGSFYNCPKCNLEMHIRQLDRIFGPKEGEK